MMELRHARYHLPSAARDRWSSGGPAEERVPSLSTGGYRFTVRQTLFFGHSLSEKSHLFSPQIAIAVFGHFLRCSSGHVMVLARLQSLTAAK
jgi:hypothetical protein